MRNRGYLTIIPLVAMLAVLPLLLKGPSCGHDFAFHLHNWLEVGSQWKQGVLYPRWDFTAAWNSGEPRFVFYPPLSWSLGALLGLILPWPTVPLVYIWFVLIACGLSMYHLASQWTSPGNALVVASFYMVHPYMLFVFYERAAYAEFLAAAWVPLLFWSILRPRLSVPGIAAPVALLWLSNAPAAVMACYSLALLAVMRLGFICYGERRVRPALGEAAKIAGGTVLGIALAGFYVVPAAFQQRWLHLDLSIKGVRYQDNFIFTHLGDPAHDAILRTASLCALSLLLLILAFTVAALDPRAASSNASAGGESVRRRVVFSLAGLACVVGFLLTPLSTGASGHIPEISSLQFPMRWCLILGATSAALLALASARIKLAPFAASAAFAMSVALILSFVGNSLFRQYCSSDQAITGLVAAYLTGSRYDSFDVYVPQGADSAAVQHANPAYWLAKTAGDAAPPAADPDYSLLFGRRQHFVVAAPVPSFLVLSLREYPAWKVSINGVPVTRRPHRSDGLMVLPVASGTSTVDLVYARTRDETAGWILSAISFLILLSIARRRTAVEG